MAASNPMSLPTAAVAPKPPAVPGRKNLSGARDAAPMWQATSTPRASAATSCSPRTPPRRSAWASAAGTTAVIACTTAPSCTQSNSELWI